MKKLFSLIKASMTEGMNIFKVNTRNKNATTKIILPIFLALFVMFAMYSYAELLIQGLVVVNLEYVLLTLFILFTSVLTLIEGIYKSGNLLFNCKDDNLLLSLPIKKSEVLFIRIFKFYVFELLYNSLFLLPAMIAYARYTNPSVIYYVISFIGLLVFPIVPIIISCIIGSFITFAASKFKGKNFVQTIITVVMLICVMYFSYNSENLINDFAKNASNINNFITKIYYPAGAYIELITNFNVLKLIEFLIFNIGVFIITILLIGNIFFNINSSIKSIKTNKNKKEFKVKTSTSIKALIKKEFNRFINSPVFVSNAGFGLVLFILGCILISIKFDSVVETIIGDETTVSPEYLKSYLPILLFGFVCFTSFMTSITSSMISLEGKSFNILKSLPLKPYKIIMSKVLTAVIIMIPCIIIGDIIIFIRFKFDVLNIVLILITSVLMPLIAETIGIIINLKYPRMDARNDTEVVKQSMSSMICVFIGMALTGITAVILFKLANLELSNTTIIEILIAVYLLLYFGLLTFLQKTCDKNFDNIVV